MADVNVEPMRHQLRVTVDPEVGRVSVTPSPVYIASGDTVEWTYEGGPFAIQFEPFSPLARRRLWTTGDQTTVEGEIRANNVPGTYRYFVAVWHDGEIYTEDPELIDDPPVRSPPNPG